MGKFRFNFPDGAGSFDVQFVFVQIMIQGVPINMGIQWRLLYCLRSLQHFFMNTILAVYQLKQIISETHWSWDFQNVVYHFCIFKIDGDMANFVQISIYLINQNCIIFKIQERYIYMVYQFMKSSSDLQPCFFLLSVPCIKYQKSKTTYKSSFNSHVYWDC